MLINLSNHPSDQWEPVQLRKAQATWGDVADIPFPAVDPALSLEELFPAIESCFDFCLREAGKYGQAVAFHIMGESVFCYHLISRLRRAGYTVVASTAVRDSVCRADGVKISKFKFVRFREY